MFTAASIALIAAVFVASAVEAVEAFTIVLAMGLTRGWKAAICGTAAALLALAAITTVVGVALIHYVSQSLLQFVIGALLLIFGLQWLRKSVLRSSGLKSIHDEDRIFREEEEAAAKAGREVHLGLDWFGFVVSFKGVLLEGLEVVFIVITFGLKARATDPYAMVHASAGALVAIVLVVIAGAIARSPLSAVPENTMKYAVGLLLSTFGVYWSVEGLGFFGPQRRSLEWPGDIWALAGVLAAWIIVSRATVIVLRALARREVPDAVGGASAGLPSEAAGGK
jgi:uncharacterized membrane protein